LPEPPVPPIPPAPAPSPPEPPAPAEPQPAGPDLASARNAVMDALASQPTNGGSLEPIQALNAQPLGDPLHQPEPPATAPAPQPQALPAPNGMVTGSTSIIQPTAPQSGMPPPPVPPPMMPPS
jgi:hypothetical protein